ncbi:MAG: hypothetical protein PHO56_02175 [Patescibacteria group bacterium]|nr:hypothetical protein [Patescibacteria group bacterium]
MDKGKKKELTLQEKMTIALTKNPIKLPTSKEMLEEMIVSSFKIIEKNKTVLEYVESLLAENPKDKMRFIQKQAIAEEIKSGEHHLAWLLDRI